MVIADPWRHLGAQEAPAGSLPLDHWRARGRSARQVRSNHHHAGLFGCKPVSRLQDSSTLAGLRDPGYGSSDVDGRCCLYAVLAVAPYEGAQRPVRPCARPASAHEADGCFLEGVGELCGPVCRLGAGCSGVRRLR